jgi:hypothetical protein
VPSAGGSDKAEVAADFGGCNSLMSVQISDAKGLSGWYAIAYRNGDATARIALVRDGRFTTRDVTSPCLLLPSVGEECRSELAADAAGSVERGAPTGDGAFAGHKIASYLNRTTGRATIELDGRAFRTFDKVKQFSLVVADDESQFGLFGFLQKPANAGCTSYTFVFFASRTSAPQLIPDFASCADHSVSMTRRTGGAVDVFHLAFQVGDPHGFVLSVVDRKVATSSVMLPLCLLTVQGSKSEDCVREALGSRAGTAAGPMQPPASAASRPKRP